jgi:hypothetical protein
VISRETLRALVYNLIMGYDGPDGRVDGVVNFWSDDVDFDRLTDSILAWFAAPDVRREVVEQEMGYRLRTIAAYYHLRGRHGKVPDPAFIAREIQDGTDAVLAALPAPPALDEAEVAIEARRRYPAPSSPHRGGRLLAHAEGQAFIAGARFADARLRGETHG